jgi:hypothetical protein
MRKYNDKQIVIWNGKMSTGYQFGMDFMYPYVTIRDAKEVGDTVLYQVSEIINFYNANNNSHEELWINEQDLSFCKTKKIKVSYSYNYIATDSGETVIDIPEAEDPEYYIDEIRENVLISLGADSSVGEQESAELHFVEEIK